MKKIIIYIFITTIIVCSMSFSVIAKDIPYQGYTYNESGEAILSPNGYLPEDVYTGLSIGTGKFSNPEDLFIDKVNKKIYICDTGNNRIVITDLTFNLIKEIKEFVSLTGEIESLSSPSGIFVKSNNEIYISDTENGRVIVCDSNGKIIKNIGKPDTAILKNYEYFPKKVCVDSQGIIYIQAKNIFQGIIMLNSTGKFTSFFGVNTIELTPQLLMQMVWRRFMTYEQRKGDLNYVPMEYSNIFIDPQDFIYATVPHTQNSVDEIKKLNFKGVNVLRVDPFANSAIPKNNYGDYPIYYLASLQKEDTTFVDVCVDENNFIYALDNTRGRVFVYDQESNFLFAFGGIGQQKGLFSMPSAVGAIDGKVIVLDSKTGSITTFIPTQFGVKVKEAILLYNQGEYIKAQQPWQQVLKQNVNYNLAYVGLGKASMRIKEYQKAMGYFKLGYDKKGYSDASSAYYLEIIKNNIAVTIILLLVVLFSPFIISIIKKKIKKKNIKTFGENL